MSDDSLRWLGPKPDLTDPVLIVMLTGWIDAGGAARAAMEAIELESEATPVAEFDDDVYVDYRARRPVMELRDGLNTVLQWERITIGTGVDQAGRDLVVMSGPEPDTAWHRFTRLVGDTATELGITAMAHLGAYPFAVPHTRPARISVSSPSQDVLARVPFLRSSIDVPAGVAASLEHELHDRGIPSIGIWAQVPHYISTMAYPAASVALLDGLREATDVVLDATTLRSDVMIQGRRIDAMVAGNAEHAQMIAQLEEIYDESDGSVELTDDVDDSLEMRSGDELAAELEEFLREQD
ncbi:MAG: PAC2 family protein [Ilumatobacter sp.]|uniref:proteasome assembly chaperone family protein n=1 Tax=Ilumatobacter sp. TaxID=1967498 RepID=UPI00261D90A2|nr:PAC2 family protein [Ilumatobacter sp.]MDJ0767833.1 PAC2 family protein [Ilumatobacter sp.]